MYEYMQDSIFLQKMENMPLKTQYIKLVLLDFAENPIREIQGQVQNGGTINVNGSSSLRRTLSFTMFASIKNNNLTNIDNLISLNKKIKVYIGYENNLIDYEKYGDIIWFKCGTYVIAQANISTSVSGSTISIQAKDKMVMLNGTVGGTIPMALVLHERYEEVQSSDGTSFIQITYPTIFQIIYEVVSQFGGEATSNIIVSDLLQSAKMLVKYNGTKKFYLAKDLSTFLEANNKNELYDKELNPDDYDEYIYGQDVGFQETDFTFPGDLTFAAGSTVTQVLDKICQTLGNYEYFYDIDGHFIFQEKKNYLNNSYTPLTNLGTKQYIKQFSNSKYMHTFNNLNNITSVTLSPKYENIKNDFVVWGQRKTASGSSVPIRYHLAIDSKPQIQLAGQFMYKIIKEDSVVEYKFYSSQKDEELLELTGEILVGYPCSDWREELYRQALIREKDGVTPTTYDIELLAEWRKIYDSSNLDWRSTNQEDFSASDNYWNPLVFTSPGSLDYWLDFLDDGEDLRKFSCAAIGRRTKVVNNNTITSIFNGEVQDIVFLENTQDDILSDKKKYYNNSGQKFILIKPEDLKIFTISSTGASAFDVMRDTIYQSLIYNTAITINCTPIYYLEPNNLIYLNSDENITGEYAISQFSLPLNYKGTMSISATQALTRI